MWACCCESCRTRCTFVPVSDMNKDIEKYLLTKQEINGAYPHENVRIGCMLRGTYLPCEILNKTSNGNSTEYEVSIRKWNGEGEDHEDYMNNYGWSFPDDNVVGVKMHSADIKFFVGPYSSDQYMKGAFRHHIGVPNDLWPVQWMNLHRSNKPKKGDMWRRKRRRKERSENCEPSIH